MGAGFEPTPNLTEIEGRVLELLVEGADSRAIESELQLSRNQVRTNIQNILTKLNVHSRTEAAAYGARHGIPLDEDLWTLGDTPMTAAEHHHPGPMEDVDLLAHKRFVHRRAVPRFQSVDSQELRRLHDLMHEMPPAPTSDG